MKTVIMVWRKDPKYLNLRTILLVFLRKIPRDGLDQIFGVVEKLA